jgi:hypothetical protein
MLALPVNASGQEATLSGTVIDSTGAVLPGATLTAVHQASGNAFEGVTDERGSFRIAARAGIYRVTAGLTGFSTVTRDGVELLVGQQISVNLQLSPSSVQEAITVTGAAKATRNTGSRSRARASSISRACCNWGSGPPSEGGSHRLGGMRGRIVGHR